MPVKVGIRRDCSAYSQLQYAVCEVALPPNHLDLFVSAEIWSPSFSNVSPHLGVISDVIHKAAMLLDTKAVPPIVLSITNRK